MENEMENIPKEISDKVKLRFDKIDAQQEKIQEKAEAYALQPNQLTYGSVSIDAFIAGANEVIQHPQEYIALHISKESGDFI